MSGVVVQESSAQVVSVVESARSLGARSFSYHARPSVVRDREAVHLQASDRSGGLVPPAMGRWAPAVSHLWGPLCL